MPLSFRLPGSVMAMALALSPVSGLAQAPGQTPKSKQSAPKAQQAQPQNGAPVIVQLRPEPAQPDWTKVCGKDEKSKAEVCYTTRDFVTDKGQRMLAVAVYDITGKNAQKTLRILMPLGFLVPPGIRITVDKGQPVAGRYDACFPHGCFAVSEVKDNFIAAFKKGTVLNINARNQAGAVVTFAVPVDGFAKAFDGPPIDPKILTERQKKMQDELQRRSEELRKRLSGQPSNPVPQSAADAVPQPKN